MEKVHGLLIKMGECVWKSKILCLEFYHVNLSSLIVGVKSEVFNCLGGCIFWKSRFNIQINGERGKLFYCLGVRLIILGNLRIL